MVAETLSSDSSPEQQQQHLWPPEFICPVSKSVMSDPVIVDSGQTYERRCIEAWFSLGHQTCPKQSVALHHLFLIPNIALRTSILTFAQLAGMPPPQPPPLDFALSLAKNFIPSDCKNSAKIDEIRAVFTKIFPSDCKNSAQIDEIRAVSTKFIPSDCKNSAQIDEIRVFSKKFIPSDCKNSVQIDENATVSKNFIPSDCKNSAQIDENGAVSKKFIPSDCKNSDQFDEIPSVSIGNLSHSATGTALRDVDRRGNSVQKEALPLTLTTRPVSSTTQMQEEQGCFIDSCLLENIVKNLQHMHAMEIEKAAQKLLQLTRQSAESRRDLCTPEILSVLLPHLRSRYTGIQVISLAVMVNLSLEKENKIKIVRAGAVPFLIDVLKSGNSEAQGHAAGAIFSLALEDENKIAIGVLGAIPPLIHLFRAGSVSTRKDAAMALYHLSHSRANRAKLVKVGAVPILLNIAQVEKGDLACRALLILCNVAATPEGRAAMLELNAINMLIKLISSENLEIQEHAAAVLLFLSQSILRFKSLVMEAGALEAIRCLSDGGTPRAREKALALLAVLKENSEDVGSSSTYSRSFRSRLQQYGLNSSEF